MRAWIYKRDEAGKPRRFLTPGEAILWALRQTGKVFGAFAGVTLLNAAIGSYRDGWSGWLTFGTLLAAVWLAIWLGVSLVIFFYIALSGGVMDEEARRRYRNNETI